MGQPQPLRGKLKREVVATDHRSLYLTEDELVKFLAPLDRALSYNGGTHNLDDIREAVQAGHMQCWPGVDSVVITEIVDTPQKRLLNFFLAVGNLEEIQSLYHTIIAWGKSLNCDRATIGGRPGWARTFLTREEGWTTSLVLYERELDDDKRRKPDSNDLESAGRPDSTIP